MLLKYGEAGFRSSRLRRRPGWRLLCVKRSGTRQYEVGDVFHTVPQNFNNSIRLKPAVHLAGVY